MRRLGGGPERAFVIREIGLRLRRGRDQRLNLLGDVVEGWPDRGAERGGESPLGKVPPVTLHRRCSGSTRQDPVALRHFEELLAENPELRGGLVAEQYGLRDSMAEAVAPRIGASPGDLRCQVVAIAILSTTHLALDFWSAGNDSGQPVDAIRSAYRVLEPLFTQPG